jgi:1-deoxy-D-xylulose-5-phosphate reductoisomerase
VIEASLIFKLPINKFKIIIHPQSLIHAIIKFRNGLSTMLYHNNDMTIPISNSLYDNFYINKKIDNKFYLEKMLTFFNPEIKKFPSIKILMSANALNETGFVLINVLNEMLVSRFLSNKILFTDIVYKLLSILRSKTVKNYLKSNRIQHINDVFKVYNFCRSLVN